MKSKLTIYFGDNLNILKTIPNETVDLIYIDPPFNTGKVQKCDKIKTIQDPNGDRSGFKGKRYKTIKIGTIGYDDFFDDYLSFLEPRLIESKRILKNNGSFFIHIDFREVHYVKILMDLIFGRDCFMNEIIWAYDYGAKSKKKWPTKHDNILWYVKNPNDYCFNLDECDRIPYMAPGLVGSEKASKGKIPTDVWWHTIVSPNGKEKTGYPNQKPRGILDRIVKVHSNPGDLLMDFFAGSGSFGESALALGRKCILIDKNESALQIMEKRFSQNDVEWINWIPNNSRNMIYSNIQ